MLESTKRKSDFEDIISEDYKFFSKTELSDKKSRLRCKQFQRNLNEQHTIPDDHNMTRKTRARRPRIQVLQSGYCAICNLPYNSVEDHIQSKKHQKLIGEDANYIALNGYIHSDVGIESLLSLTGIDAIGFDNDFSPTVKRRNMPKTKISSVVSEVRQSPAALPVRNDSTGHHLRSRKNINYMTPPLEEDSLTEKPDLEPPVRLEYKEYRELRSSTRALAKLTSVAHREEPEVWNSGRPKRSCIGRQKRVSADERLVADNKTYYKVEVLSNKLRSTDSKERENNKTVNSSKNDSEKLIVKFKKLRNSELVQLNNEATNFLFPKKDESSEEDGDEVEGDEVSATSEEPNETTTSSVASDDEFKKPKKFKVEEESSMDSILSDSSKKKKRRRTHAEALINDNQKYYKFETPGSSSFRLRYHGSYLSPVTIKSNGDCTVKVEKVEAPIKKEVKSNVQMNIDDYQFSFESVPQNQTWYQTFLRHDRIEQKYHFTPNYYWNDFVMPHKIPHLKALDPTICMSVYRDVLQTLTNPAIKDIETNEEMKCGPELEDTVIEPSELELDDENSKISSISISSSSSLEPTDQNPPSEVRRSGKRKTLLSPGKNPRKSPRQHASTLAILSLLHQRKRRSKNGLTDTGLQTIPEEEPPPPVRKQEKPTPPPPPPPSSVQKVPRMTKKGIDYMTLASKIDEELDSALDCDLDLELDANETYENVIGNSEVQVTDILKMYEESRKKESEYACRRFFNGTPGRKPGKRKKNKTGWPSPNKAKRKRQLKEDNDSAPDSVSINQDSDEDSASNDSIKISSKENVSKRVPSTPVQTNEYKDKVLNSELQPFVYVKKLDSERIADDVKLKVSPKRTSKRQRRVPGSPKSPRMLRRPRGRWYRER